MGGPSCGLSVPISLEVEGPPWASVQAKLNVLPVFTRLGLSALCLILRLILFRDLT